MVVNTSIYHPHMVYVKMYEVIVELFGLGPRGGMVVYREVGIQRDIGKTVGIPVFNFRPLIALNWEFTFLLFL